MHARAFTLAGEDAKYCNHRYYRLHTQDWKLNYCGDKNSVGHRHFTRFTRGTKIDFREYTGLVNEVRLPTAQ